MEPMQMTEYVSILRSISTLLLAARKRREVTGLLGKVLDATSEFCAAGAFNPSAGGELGPEGGSVPPVVQLPAEAGEEELLAPVGVSEDDSESGAAVPLPTLRLNETAAAGLSGAEIRAIEAMRGSAGNREVSAV